MIFNCYRRPDRTWNRHGRGQSEPAWQLHAPLPDKPTGTKFRTD